MQIYLYLPIPLLLIIYLFLIYFFPIKLRTTNFKYIRNDPRLISSRKTYSDYPGYNNLILNYNGKCGKVFKYAPNSNRDIIIFSYKYLSLKKEIMMLNLIPKVIDSFKNGIPNARLLCFIPKNNKYTLISLLLSYLKLEIIYFDDYLDYSIVLSRFLIIKDYLKKNKNNLDRIILSDLNDVFIFDDIFKTISKDELTIFNNCLDYDTNEFCLKFGGEINNYKWLLNAYGKETTDYFLKKNYTDICAGVIFGGIEKMIQFLEEFTEKFDLSKKDLWGYDETLLNKMFYFNEFKVKINIEGCSQRNCMDSIDLLSNSRANILVYEKDGCSPIMGHKTFPRSWRHKRNKKDELF